jgi:hypothetical protein
VALWTLAVLSLSGAVSARAGTVWYVNPKAKEQPHDGTTWNRGFVTVHDALDAARAGDEIWITEGEYIPSRGSTTISNCHFLISKDVTLRGGFVGTEASVAERSENPSDHPTIFEGRYPLDPAHRKKHVLIITTAEGCTLDRLTVQRGRAFHVHNNQFNTGAGAFIKGGGKYTIIDCTFREHFCHLFGAAVSVWNGAEVTFVRCRFERNRAEQKSNDFACGGGVAVLDSRAVFQQCAFVDNFASWYGGGVFGFNAIMLFVDCEFSGNKGDSGRAMAHGPPFPGQDDFDPQVHLRSVGAGGAIGATCSNCTVIGCRFIDNQAGAFVDCGSLFRHTPAWSCRFGCSESEGVCNTDMGPPFTHRFERCEFTRNSGAAAGGIFFQSPLGSQARPTQLIVDSCLFDGNSGTGGPFGAAISFFGSLLRLNNVTIVNNYKQNAEAAPFGGVAQHYLPRADNRLIVTNCIFWGNEGDGGVTRGEKAALAWDPRVEATLKNNLIQGLSDLPCTDCLSVDPQFVHYSALPGGSGPPPEDNDYHLTAGSPVVDAGDSESVMGEQDLDGNPRVYRAESADGKAGVVDLGAYESRSAPRAQDRQE